MNTKRLIVLGFALIAAVAAAFLVRGLAGGGTSKAIAKLPPPVAMSDVLVASVALQPGQALSADQVRWEKWPSNAVDSTFITREGVSSTDEAVKGTVVRAPLVAGQPITNTAIVHANAAGFMAAILNPGMRAVSITITADSGAGGFILPNDRIDLILSQKLSGNPPQVRAHTILSNVRVLAVDQTFKQDKDTKTVIGKTATLEMTPSEAELVARAQSQGSLSLSLRPLSEAEAGARQKGEPAPVASAMGGDVGNGVEIIRYGISRDDAKAGAAGAQ
jgi:pilus assembly protein CpaB